jgi:hypothetical protein
MLRLQRKVKLTRNDKWSAFYSARQHFSLRSCWLGELANVRCGSKGEILAVSRCFPLFSQQQTFDERDVHRATSEAQSATKQAIRDWKQNLDRKASAELSSRGTLALQDAMDSQIRLELERLKECLAKIR